MCGGFVCFYAGAARSSVGGGGISHVAYNGGRLLSYLLLGLLAGMIGVGLDRAGALAGVARAAAVVAGALMIAWGSWTLLALRGVRLPRLEGWGVGRGALGRWLAALRGRSPVVRAGATGLLTTLLPCGWLYTFVVAAAGTGRVIDAVATMAIFWLGTLPVMIGLGVGAQRIAGALRARLPLLTATTVIVLGVLALTGRLQLDARVLAEQATRSDAAPWESGAPGHSHATRP